MAFNSPHVLINFTYPNQLFTHITPLITQRHHIQVCGHYPTSKIQLNVQVLAVWPNVAKGNTCMVYARPSIRITGIAKLNFGALQPRGKLSSVQALAIWATVD